MKHSQAQSQTPPRMNQSHQSHRKESGNKSQKRRTKVKFDENHRISSSNHLNATPRSSRDNRVISLGNKSLSNSPTHKHTNGNNTFVPQIPQHLMQQPAFFGIPGLVPNHMKPLYFQQPQMSQQQNQAPIQQQQFQQHQIQQQRMQQK